MNTELLF